MLIRIKRLHLRAIVGVFEWEQMRPQDLIISLEIEFDGRRAAESDDLADTVDYKAIKKRILSEIESGRFQLVERVAGHVLKIVMDDPRVVRATVEVEKPHALRFADSVSVVHSMERKE